MVCSERLRESAGHTHHRGYPDLCGNGQCGHLGESWTVSAGWAEHSHRSGGLSAGRIFCRRTALGESALSLGLSSKYRIWMVDIKAFLLFSPVWCSADRSFQGIWWVFFHSLRRWDRKGRALGKGPGHRSVPPGGAASGQAGSDCGGSGLCDGLCPGTGPGKRFSGYESVGVCFWFKGFRRGKRLSAP